MKILKNFIYYMIIGQNCIKNYYALTFFLKRQGVMDDTYILIG